jgi:P-type Mg2+ transporter
MTAQSALPTAGRGLTPLPPPAAPRGAAANVPGLTAADAARLFAAHGPNEPAPTRGTRGGAVLELLRPLANPLLVMLLAAGLVSAAAGDVADAAIIAATVVLSAALGALQTARARRAAERLRQVVAPTATVCRGGVWVEVARREIVPGDLVRLAAGDLVPADARLVEARDLHVQQAALTGEPMPAAKEAPAAGAALDQTGPDAPALVFLGTSVVSGSATAVVTATGAATVFGGIAQRLASRPPETEFERGLRRFGFLIAQAVVLLVLGILLSGIVMHRDMLQTMLFAAALAVGLVPEFLPVITTVTLTAGAVRMARSKVIVKRLAAIQNFGSIDVLCSDKTGTLTGGAMRLDRALDPAGRPSERALLLAYLNSHFETGIRSPLDDAVLARGERSPPDVAGYVKVDEMPFDFERRRLSIVVDTTDGERLLITKGAPEGVLACCAGYETPEGSAALDADGRRRCVAAYEALSAEGYRVLAVAARPAAYQAAYAAADEHDLVLAGFLAFSDPPAEGAADALRALRDDGVRVVVLTGDNELVTRHVCEQVGLDGGTVVLGSEIDRLGDAALAHVAERTAAFARVSPAQKSRILLALKSRGHVVGFLGDGINDAPSLHAADVGISVSTAVDVAKDAADEILMEPGLRVLHTGIVEGRKAFGNVMKYLLMGTSSNFGNMFSMAAAALLLPFLPLLPTQILVNNFLYDVAQLTIPSDRVDAAYVRKPRRWDIGSLRAFMLSVGPISSAFDFLTFWVLLRVMHAPVALFRTGWFVESLVTQTLVLLVIRTAGNPLRSRPSPALLATTLAVASGGLVLPFSPLAAPLGFVPLPPAFFAYLAGVVASYLAVVQLVKQRAMRRILA